MNFLLKEYIESEILPLYDNFDDAHKRNHAQKVIEDSLKLADMFDVNINMVYAVAAYHDTGLSVNRKTHHLESGRIVREDKALSKWFSPDQIEIIAQAVEDHRASAERNPRSVYGKIVAEADRNIDVDTILLRTVQFGLSHYPELDNEGHVKRALSHLHEKYGPNGYLKLWIPGSRNEVKLHELWRLMEDESAMRSRIEEILKKRTRHASFF